METRLTLGDNLITAVDFSWTGYGFASLALEPSGPTGIVIMVLLRTPQSSLTAWGYDRAKALAV